MKIIVYFLLILSFSFIPLAFSDTIVLKSGAKITGVIESEADDSVTVLMSIGTAKYPKSQVESITRASAEENASLKQNWEEAKKKREAEQEEKKKFAAEQEAKGLVLLDGRWVPKPAEEKPKEKPAEEPKKEPEFKKTDMVKFKDEKTGKSYSYAVRYPDKYDKNKRYPVLFTFDPLGSGEWANKKCAYAADKLNWIEVGSFDSKNGLSWEETEKIHDALLKDVIKRFKVDDKRFYSAGLSGGARSAIHFAYRYPNNFKGALLSCAGTSGENDMKKNVAVYLYTGKDDMNLEEVKYCSSRLKEAHVNTEIYISDGGHDWPSPEVMGKALDWLAKQK